MTNPALFSLLDPNFVLLLAVLAAEVVAPLLYAAWSFRRMKDGLRK